MSGITSGNLTRRMCQVMWNVYQGAVFDAGRSDRIIPWDEVPADKRARIEDAWVAFETALES